MIKKIFILSWFIIFYNLTFSQTYRSTGTGTSYKQAKKIKELKAKIEDGCYPLNQLEICNSCKSQIKNKGFMLCKSHDDKFKWLVFDNRKATILKIFKKEKKAVKYYYDKIHDMYIDKYLLIGLVNNEKEKEKLTSEILDKKEVNSVTSDINNEGKYRIWIDECNKLESLIGKYINKK